MVLLLTGCWILALLSPASALYEDQVGEFDWVQRYVGRIAFAASRPRARPESRFTIVASTNGVIAALNDRFVSWKRALEDDDQIDQVTLSDDGAHALVLSNGGLNVRLLRTQDGASLWEQISVTGPPSPAPCRPYAIFLREESDGGRPRILALSAACELRELKFADGTGVSAVTVADGASSFDRGVAIAFSANESAPVVYLLGDASLRVVILSTVARQAAAGAPFEVRDIALPGGASRGLATALEGAGVVVASSAGKLLLLRGPEYIPVELQVPSEAGAGWIGVEGGQEPGLDARAAYFVATSGVDGSKSLLAVAEGGQEAAVLVKGAGVLSRAVPTRDGSLAVARADVSKDGRLAYAIVPLGGKHSGPSASWTLAPADLTRAYDLQRRDGGPNPSRAAPLRSLFLLATAESDGLDVLHVGDDDQAICMHTEGSSGALRWWRDEFLAEAQHTVFVDLPAPTAAAAAARDQSVTLQQRIRLQFLRVKAMLGHTTRLETFELQVLGDRASGKMQPVRDLYGFRRAMVVASPTAGRVSALHSGDGRILWSTRVVDERAAADCTVSSLGLWANSHNMDVADQVYAIKACGGGNAASSTSVVILDAFSGAVLESIALDFVPVRWVAVPQPLRAGPLDRHAFLAVRPDGASAQVVPASLAAHVAKEGSALHFWAVADAAARIVRGYGLAPSASPAGSLDLTPLWEARLEGHGRVVAQATRDPRDKVYSALRPLPGRGLALKYTNPNTAAVVVGPKEGAVGDATVYLLDTVTGRVLHSQTQRGAAGPFAAVFGEHWVVVHFYLPQSGRHALLSIDLYETQAPAVGATDLLASTAVPVKSHVGSGVASSRVVSRGGGGGGDVEVHSRIYFAPHGARTLAASWTAKGIAQRMILLGTTTGQIYAIDRRLVDARRPIPDESAAAMAAARTRPQKKRSVDGDEHALLPYSEHVQLHGMSYLSHKYRVEGLRELGVSPTGLESTSLLLALGSDHFFTRVQPSEQFDSLREDFAYGGVLGTMALMAAGAYALRSLAKKGDFERAWR